MTPREVLELPFRQWVAMALSVDTVRKQRAEQARRNRRTSTIRPRRRTR